MRRALAPVALAALLFTPALAPAATLGSPHPPDARLYPSLASLAGWLKSDAPGARSCSTTVALTLSARSAYEKAGSEAQAIEAIANGLVQASGGKTDPAIAKQLSVGYVRTAVTFMPLPREAAGMAIAALCRSAVQRGDRPFADEALLKRLIGDARGCLAGGFVDGATTPLPMECVVKTFDRRS